MGDKKKGACEEITTVSDESSEATKMGSEVVVTVNDDALSDVKAVVRRLEDSGLAVDHVLDFIGQVTGHCEDRAIDALREVKGVDAVEISRKIQLPPFGSLIQ